jgi:hypothetical protein
MWNAYLGIVLQKMGQTMSTYFHMIVYSGGSARNMWTAEFKGILNKFQQLQLRGKAGKVMVF